MALRILFYVFCALPVFAQTPIKLSVDASHVTRRLVHSSMEFPVKAGPFTLAYPEWIPGEHGPTGPIADLVGLRIMANGNPIPWKRDGSDMYAFRMDIPAGVDRIKVAVDFISAPGDGFSAGGSTTSELSVLSWNQLLLYPKGTPSDQLQFQADLKVPAGWRYGTALPIASESGETIHFKPSSLTTLVDSPVSMGRYFKTVDLSPGSPSAHYLHIAGDTPQAIEITPREVADYRNLVRETGALFGVRHYASYHFLLTLSDHVAHFGLEHHESSDDRVAERALIDDSLRRFTSGLLPHEFVHSWNGKFRRPEGLATSDYSEPMKGELLWVYEGLTEYLGEILTPRSGLLTAEQYREQLAMTAAELDNSIGRRWRPLEDTTIAAQILYGDRSDYADYRRGVDFYPEGTLIWLEADVMIRTLSGGTKSLDDFCKLFHGGPGGKPGLKTYTFDDVVAALVKVQPYDWSEFLRSRISTIQARAPLGGVEGSGWKLTYTDQPSEMWTSTEAARKIADFTYAIGLKVKDDGTITDVKVDSPAFKAGIAPSLKLIAVNGRAFNFTVLREEIRAAANDSGATELLVRDGDYFKTFKAAYHGGERYPQLVRNGAKPDLLTAIISPHAR